MKPQKKYTVEICKASEEVPVEELAMILAQIYIASMKRKANERAEKIPDPVQ